MKIILSNLSQNNLIQSPVSFTETLSIYKKEDTSPIVCPYLDTDGNCLIIYQLTDVPHYPSRKQCVGCQRCPKPQSVNEITTAISNKILMEQGLSTLHSIGHGPGTRLANTISWFFRSSPGCNCGDRAEIMDAWGKEGCKRNKSQIVHWLYESAHLKNIPITRGAIEIIIDILLSLPYTERPRN